MQHDNIAASDVVDRKWECICICRSASLHLVPAVVRLLSQFPGGLCRETQRWFVRYCVKDALNALFPRSQRFERRLLLAVAAAAERQAHHADVADELADALTASLVHPRQEISTLEPEWSYRIYSYAPAALNDATAWESISRVEQDTLALAHRDTLDGSSIGAAGGVQHGTTDTAIDGTTANPRRCIGRTTAKTWGSTEAEAGVMAFFSSNNLLQGGTGCHEWEAGFYLAEYCLSNAAALFRGKVCVELGSGVGTVGIALARAGASDVLCTDGDDEAVSNCRRNLALNGVLLEGMQPSNERKCSGLRQGAKLGRTSDAKCGAGAAPQVVRARRLRWEDGWRRNALCDTPVDGAEEIDATKGSSGQLSLTASQQQSRAEERWTAPDVILGADLLYDPDSIPVLLNLLRQMLQTEGTAPRGRPSPLSYEAGGVKDGTERAPFALIATTRRNEATLEAFLAAAAKEAEKGLRIEDVTATALESTMRGVRFCHVAALENARERILLHILYYA